MRFVQCFLLCQSQLHRSILMAGCVQDVTDDAEDGVPTSTLMESWMTKMNHVLLFRVPGCLALQSIQKKVQQELAEMPSSSFCCVNCIEWTIIQLGYSSVVIREKFTSISNDYIYARLGISWPSCSLCKISYQNGITLLVH